MQIGKAARSNGSHIKSRLKMEPHGVFKEVTKQCTNKDHYQSAQLAVAWRRRRPALWRGRGPPPHENCSTKARTIPLLSWFCYHDPSTCHGPQLLMHSLMRTTGTNPRAGWVARLTPPPVPAEIGSGGRTLAWSPWPKTEARVQAPSCPDPTS